MLQLSSSFPALQTSYLKLDIKSKKCKYNNECGVPIQFLGPALNGMNANGLRFSRFVVENLSGSYTSGFG